MRKFILLFLILNAHMIAGYAQSGNPGRSSRSRGYHESYSLSNRVFLKFTPSALVRLPVSTVRLGAEYCFARRFAIGVEGGRVFGKSGSRGGLTGGWAVYAEPRVYFGMSRVGHAFGGLHAFYRSLSYGGGYTTASNKYGDIISFTQESAEGKTRGFGFAFGYCFHLGDRIFLDLGLGGGSKEVDVTRVGKGPTTSPQGTSAYFYKETEVYETADLTYFVFQVKISGMLGSLH